MITAVIVSPDETLVRQLESALAKAGQVSVARKLAGFPAGHELVRLIRALAPEVFFVDVRSLEEVVRLAGEIDAHAAGTQIVGVDRDCDHGTLLELMRAGLREFLAAPFDGQELRAALLRLNAALQRKPPAIDATDLMFSFLPAKPGVGCTTLVLNTAVALAALPDTKVLLADFDLNCGMIGFLLKLAPTRWITDAAEHAHNLDEELWSRLISSYGKLDVLPADHQKTTFHIEAPQIRRLLEFARRNYRVICADLSGLMEKYSLELMKESKRIFLVATPELPSLYLAREKLAALRALELEDRVAVLLNRAQKRQMVRGKEIESMLGMRVTMEFPNDYNGVHRAICDAKPIERDSHLGRCYGELARMLLTVSKKGQIDQHRFVEYYAMVPGAYAVAEKE